MDLLEWAAELLSAEPSEQTAALQVNVGAWLLDLEADRAPDGKFAPKGTGDQTGLGTHPRATDKAHGEGLVKAALVEKGGSFFDGEPRGVHHYTKQDKGKIGESIAHGVMRLKPLKLEGDEKWADAIGRLKRDADGKPYREVWEIKTGEVANGKSAQQWRATVDGKSHKAKFLGKHPDATKEEIDAWMRRGPAIALRRKREGLRRLEQKHGIRLVPKTLGVILDGATKRAQLHVIDGYHERLSWNDEIVRNGLRGVAKYKEQAAALEAVLDAELFDWLAEDRKPDEVGA